MMLVLEDFALTYICNSLWQLPLIGSGAWTACRLLARLGSKAQYRVWTLSILLALLLPGVSTSFSSIGFRARLADARVVITNADGPEPLLHSAQPGMIALPVGVADALLALYGILMIASMSRFVFGVVRSRTLMRESWPAVLSEVESALWDRCKKAFSVGSTEVRVHPTLTGPVTCGWTRPMLLLPAGFLATCERDDLLAAFAHEAAHIERRDFLWNSLLTFVTLPVAYHPVAWFLQSQIAESRELVCDRMASARVLDAGSYAASLFRLASRISRSKATKSMHAIGIFDANILEKRMLKLSEKATPIGLQGAFARIAYSAVLAGFVVFAGSFLAVGVTPASASLQVNPSMGKQVFHVGNGVTAPILTYSVDPDYPANSTRSSGFDGICVVNIVVGKDGQVRDVSIVRSLEPAFDANAMNAVRQYRFKPGLKNGNPVAVSVDVEVNFRKY